MGTELLELGKSACENPQNHDLSDRNSSTILGVEGLHDEETMVNPLSPVNHGRRLVMPLASTGLLMVAGISPPTIGICAPNCLSYCA